MRLRVLLLTVVLTLLVPSLPARAEDKIVRLTTIDWPPFMGSGAPGDSLFLDIVKRALAARGYTIEYKVLPWKRAVEVAEANQSYVGIFPVYCDDLQSLPGFITSVPVMDSPLGLAESADKPIQWASLPDLSKYRLGTVLGYTNTKAFDEAVAAGTLSVETASSDLLNLQRLAGGRIDAAVIDAHTLDYLLDHEANLAPFKTAIRLNPHTLEDKKIFVAFRDNPAGRGIAAELAEGMKTLAPAAH